MLTYQYYYRIIHTLFTYSPFTMRSKVAATALKCNNNVIAHVIVQCEKDNIKENEKSQGFTSVGAGGGTRSGTRWQRDECARRDIAVREDIDA